MSSKSFVDSLPEWLHRLVPGRYRRRRSVVPVVRLSGAIGALMPLRSGLAMANVAPLLERAFAVPEAAAVALVINSPGGSAAQSHLIFRRIRAFAEEKNLPVLAFIEDAAASGGYMIACAADEIFADAASIVGSIGVVSASFGFDRLIERFGIERRVHTAGEHKAMLDPFRPEDPKDVERLKTLQRSVHEVFEGLVRDRRGEKLQPANGELFSGAFWVGQEAVALGLVDGLGDIRTVLRERFGDKVLMQMIEPPRQSLIGRLMGRHPAAQASLFDPAEIVAALEERSAWMRLGL